MRFNKKAFTLIELLVVIAIIGILATISVVAFQNARAKSRDARRVADIKQISTALELFFNDEGRYPTESEFNSGSIASGTNIYLAVIPVAPSTPDGDCTAEDSVYKYTQIDGGRDYSIDFCLGGTVASMNAGVKCGISSGILEQNCCELFPVAYEGGPYDADGVSTTTGGYYRTVKIGNQCWLKDNLNVGTMLCSGTPQAASCAEMPSDDNSIEKYCFFNNEINPDPNFVGPYWCGYDRCFYEYKGTYDVGGCSTDGAMYTWSEALQLPGSCQTSVCQSLITANHRGICPEGWHIPTADELHVLENYLKTDGQPCAYPRSDWQCANTGDKLKVASRCSVLGGPDCNSSGFSLIMPGYMNSSGAFSWGGTMSQLTTATEYSATYANAFHVMMTNAAVGDSSNIKADYGRGQTVRCIKN